jgi:tetratricopeptide (TPR) repeat protein
MEPPDLAPPSLRASPSCFARGLARAQNRALRHRRGRLPCAFWLVVAVLLTPLPGLADEGTSEAPRAEQASEPPSAAVRHYHKGRELYLAGRYREAAVELEQAVTLDPDSPNLVYNLARVYELLAEIDTSIVHYKRYRALLPPGDVEERARVDGTLQRLEGARSQVTELPASPAGQPVKLERGVADATFWTFTVVGAAALVAGGAVGVAALGAEKDVEKFVVEEDGDVDKRRDLEDRADRLALTSDMCLLAGAVLGTTAILLYALRQKPARSPPAAKLDVGVSPQGAFLVFRGQL